MSADQTDKVFGVTTSQTTITSDGWIGVTGGQYCNTIMFNYMSGATTAVVGSSGITFNQGWILSANTPLVLGGPGPFWITAAGTTSKVNIIKSLNSNGTL